jgi:hypothetical protein
MGFAHFQIINWYFIFSANIFLIFSSEKFYKFNFTLQTACWIRTTPLKNESSFFVKVAMGIFHSFCSLSKHQLVFYLFCHHLPVFFLLKIFTSSILPNWISKYYIHTPLKNESSFFAKSYLAMGIFHSFCTLSKHQLAFYLFCHHLPDFFF